MTVVTEVVMTSFSKKHLNTLTTDQLPGQLFATLAMFLKIIPKILHGYFTVVIPICNVFNRKLNYISG